MYERSNAILVWMTASAPLAMSIYCNQIRRNIISIMQAERHLRLFVMRVSPEYRHR